MPKQQTRIPARAPTRVPQVRVRTSPRDQLLAALPVTERRLTVNGVSTMVLEQLIPQEVKR
jgi:hypothetical protein